MKLTTLRPLAAILLACTLTACAPAASPSDSTAQSGSSVSSEAQAVTFTDDLGRTVTVERPERVAALIGSFADIWCLAGGQSTLVATANDAWTSFDLGLDDSVLDLGGVKEPNFEILLSAQPDLVLASCNTTANVDMRSSLEQANIPVAYFDIQHFSDYLRMLDICTQLTGCPERYTQYGEEVGKVIDQAIARQDGSAPTVLCMRTTGSSCKVKGSQDFLLGEMLADLGCVNVADQDSALLEDLSLEAIMAADPDYIFVVLQGSDPTKAQQTLERTLLSNPAWSSLRAVQENRFYTLEHTLYNVKPNARWGEAYEKLADILYPQ